MMYSYGGTLYKKNGSLKSQLKRHKAFLPLDNESTFMGVKTTIRANKDNKNNIIYKIEEDKE